MIKIQHTCLIKWRKRIDKAEKRDFFTDNDKVLAFNWETCAVGEGRKMLPSIVRRNGFRPYQPVEPLDEKLMELGAKFPDFLDINDFKGARNHLVKVEKRLDKVVTKYSAGQGK